MKTIMADVLKNDGSSYPDKMEAETNYQVGQKLYIMYWYKESMNKKKSTGIAEFEVTGIVLNTLINPHQTMLEIKTDDVEYKKRVLGSNSELLIFESDIEQYIAKNTELLNEIRGQLAVSLYNNGERYANVELDNGRHISVNEIRHEGKFTDQFSVSLYASSEEIQKNIFKDSGYVVERIAGPDSTDFLYKALNRLQEVNERIKTPEYFQDEQTISQPTQESDKPFSYLINRPEKSTDFIISNASGESVRLNILEFWEVVKAGNRMNARDEIENYLSDLDILGSIPIHILRENNQAMELLTDKVLDKRYSEESTDQIFDAVFENRDTLCKVLFNDIKYEADAFIDSGEEYYGMSGVELSSSEEALNIITEYIISHEMDEDDEFSDMVYYAIYACQDELHAVLDKERKVSLDEKIKDADARTGNSLKSNEKCIEKPLERD